jgi:hypothetical protein
MRQQHILNNNMPAQTPSGLVLKTSTVQSSSNASFFDSRLGSELRLSLKCTIVDGLRRCQYEKTLVEKPKEKALVF